MTQYKPSKAVLPAGGKERLNKKDAQVIGGCVNNLMRDQGGELKPKELVNYARSRNSPLHKYFEWNDGKAAEQYRVWQARMLIGWVKVELVSGKPTRAFVNLQMNDSRAYVTIENALSDLELRKQLLENSLSEINFWQQQYSSLKELSLIFKAVKKTEKKVKKIIG